MEELAAQDRADRTSALDGEHSPGPQCPAAQAACSECAPFLDVPFCEIVTFLTLEGPWSPSESCCLYVQPKASGNRRAETVTLSVVRASCPCPGLREDPGPARGTVLHGEALHPHSPPHVLLALVLPACLQSLRGGRHVCRLPHKHFGVSPLLGVTPCTPWSLAGWEKPRDYSHRLLPPPPSTRVASPGWALPAASSPAIRALVAWAQHDPLSGTLTVPRAELPGARGPGSP